MIKAILSDLSRVVLLPKDKNYGGKLNDLYKEHINEDNFNFFDYFELNEELLNIYRGFKNDASIYLFTTEYIQDDPAIKIRLETVFEKMFSADELGLRKIDPTSYQKISEEINIDPHMILYVDDLLENTQAAQKAGMQTIVFTNIQDMTNKLEQPGLKS